MQIPVLSLNAEQVKKVVLPLQFSEPVRPDLVKRVVEMLWANSRQPYGTDPLAGKRASAKVSRRRRNYRGSYGHGISRVPRKVMSHNGTQFNWVGAFAPCTVKGFRAHPPKAWKIWAHKVNKKEKAKAMRSALSATVIPDMVKGRNHVLPSVYPFSLSSDAEAVAKTKDVYELLSKLGLDQELSRAEIKSVRAGKGKRRGRPYKKRIGPLIVVGKDCALMKAARNIPGVTVVSVKSLNAELLAPGAVVGRLTVFTESAIDVLGKERLFV